MAENQNAGADPNISDEEVAKVELFKDVDPNNATPEQVSQIIKTGRTLQAQKKVWRDRAIDPTTGKPYKDLAAEATAKPNPSPAAAVDDSVKQDVQMLKTAEEKRQFGFKHNLSPEETDHVFAYAQGVGAKPADVLDKPFIKTAIDAMRANAQNEANTPGPSSRAPRVEGKTFSEMKPEERKANFGKVVSGLRK